MEPLLQRLEDSGAGRDVRIYLSVMQKWLIDNLDAFTQEDRRLYCLDQFVSMTLDDYPMMHAEFDPAVQLSKLRTIAPESVGQVGMRIGRRFWEGITIWSERDCPQCENGLRILQEEGNPDHLGYECDVCVWAEDEDGSEWQADRLVPVTTEALRRRGLLPHAN